MTAATYDLATVRVLWRRDLMRFFRQPSRIIGALGQPVLFWIVLGSGLAATFRVPGVDVGYLEFFFPGVIAMVLLFASIFAAVSVIEDRHQGFLQMVMAGPGSRASLVFGKCLGSPGPLASTKSRLFFSAPPSTSYAHILRCGVARLSTTRILGNIPIGKLAVLR